MQTEYSQIWLSLFWASVRNLLRPKKKLLQNILKSWKFYEYQPLNTSPKPQMNLDLELRFCNKMPFKLMPIGQASQHLLNLSKES